VFALSDNESNPNPWDESSRESGGQTAVIQKTVVRLKSPDLYKVLLHNDDFTPMDFVENVLTTIFRKQKSVATTIMLDVHRKGVGVCGIYPYEIAETKVSQVLKEARSQDYPLKCTMEKA
jgi:ATP-dependent Clp protease adaptor protein ClpS